jgi:hypothetical protein
MLFFCSLVSIKALTSAINKIAFYNNNKKVIIIIINCLKSIGNKLISQITTFLINMLFFRKK